MRPRRQGAVRNLLVPVAALAFAVTLLGCVGAGAGPTGAVPTGPGTTGAPSGPASPPSASPSPVTVDGRTFLSTAVTENGIARPLARNTRIRLQFVDGRLVASAGCNTMGGAYSLAGNVLQVQGLAMTDMGCDPERHAQDDWFAKLLAAGPTLAVDGANLVVEAGSSRITLLDREVAEPDLTLVGHTWVVTGFVDGDVAGSLGPTTASLVFAPDGRVQVDTGCNTGAGGYVMDEGARTLRFSAIGLTKKACADQGGATERAVLAVIGTEAVSYEIDSTNLTLTAGKRGLQLIAKP
jgi:heat shock protein HslJ